MTTTKTKTDHASTSGATDSSPTNNLVVKFGHARELSIRAGAERHDMTLAEYARLLFDMGLAAMAAMETSDASDASTGQLPLKPAPPKPSAPKPESEAGRRRRIGASVDAALLAFAKKHCAAGALPPLTYCNDKHLRRLGVCDDASGDEVGGFLASIARGDRTVEGITVEHVGGIPCEDSRPRAGYRVSLKG